MYYFYYFVLFKFVIIFSRVSFSIFLLLFICSIFVSLSGDHTLELQSLSGDVAQCCSVNSRNCVTANWPLLLKYMQQLVIIKSWTQTTHWNYPVVIIVDVDALNVFTALNLDDKTYFFYYFIFIIFKYFFYCFVYVSESVITAVFLFLGHGPAHNCSVPFFSVNNFYLNQRTCTCTHGFHQAFTLKIFFKNKFWGRRNSKSKYI